MLTQAVLSYVIIISLSFHHSFLPSFPLPALLSILGTAAGLPRFRSRRWCREVCTGRLIQWCAAEYRNCSRVSFCGSQVLIPPGSIKFSRYNWVCANGNWSMADLLFNFWLSKSPRVNARSARWSNYKQNADTRQECLHRSYSFALLLYHRSKKLSIELEPQKWTGWWYYTTHF